MYSNVGLEIQYDYIILSDTDDNPTNLSHFAGI